MRLAISSPLQLSSVVDAIDQIDEPATCLTYHISMHVTDVSVQRFYIDSRIGIRSIPDILNPLSYITLDFPRRTISAPCIAASDVSSITRRCNDTVEAMGKHFSALVTELRYLHVP